MRGREAVLSEQIDQFQNAIKALDSAMEQDERDDAEIHLANVHSFFNNIRDLSVVEDDRHHQYKLNHEAAQAIARAKAYSLDHGSIQRILLPSSSDLDASQIDTEQSVATSSAELVSLSDVFVEDSKEESKAAVSPALSSTLINHEAVHRLLEHPEFPRPEELFRQYPNGIHNLVLLIGYTVWQII